MKRCQALPGQELFQYVDENGELRSVESNDVNDYLRQTSGQDFTAKDFRTWGGTVIASIALVQLGVFESETQGKKNITDAIKSTAERLGNTPAICRKCYVHPGVIDAYLNGSLLNFFKHYDENPKKQFREGLYPEESKVLAFLDHLSTQ